MKTYRKNRSQKGLEKKILDTLLVYAKTQLLVLAVIAAVTWITLTVLGVRYALILAFVTGALSAVPFFGMTIAGLLSALVAIVDGRSFFPGLHPAFEGVAVILIYILLNQLVDFFLTPYLMSRTNNVHPLLIFSAIVVGSSAFGIVGTILAIPVVLVAKTVLEHYADTAPPQRLQH